MTTHQGATAGPWRIEEVLSSSEDGEQIVELSHNRRTGALLTGRSALPHLLVALMTYLDVEHVEATGAAGT